MKNTLKNIALAGTFLLGSLGLQAQINPNIKASQREIKRELGTNSTFDLDYLGNGYVSLKGPGKYNSEMSSTERKYRNENLEDMKIIQGLNSGSFKVEKTDEGIEYSGTYFNSPNKETLEEIDCIKKDYVITPEEIEYTLAKKVKEIL